MGNKVIQYKGQMCAVDVENEVLLDDDGTRCTFVQLREIAQTDPEWNGLIQTLQAEGIAI